MGAAPPSSTSLQAMMNLTDPAYVRELTQAHGFRFTKSLGQNFLVRREILEKTLSVCAPDAETGVLEIGPGIGTLTQALAEKAGRVAAVELDARLLPILAETLSEYDNISITQFDALKLDLPAFCEEKLPTKRRIVCANLPYYITAPAVEKLLASRLFSSVTLMLQYEAVKRICAKPGDENYCALSALADFYAERTLAFSVPADCFYPRPGVGSALIHLAVREPALYPEPDRVLSLIRAAFSQRRKTLANALANSGFCARTQAEDALIACGFARDARAETLSGSDFAYLAEKLEEK